MQIHLPFNDIYLPCIVYNKKKSNQEILNYLNKCVETTRDFQFNKKSYNFLNKNSQFQTNIS